MTTIDSVIFEMACRIAIEADNNLIDPARLVPAVAEKGVSETQIMESQEILEGRHYIELHLTAGPPHVYAFSITLFGFDQYVQAAIPDYSQLCADVARLLVREECTGHRDTAQALGQPVFLIEHIFRSFEHNGLVRLAESFSGGIYLDVRWVSPELRRKLESAS